MIQVKIVPIHQPRASLAAIFKPAFELCKNSKVVSKMGVRVNHVTLEPIPVLVLRSAP